MTRPNEGMLFSQAVDDIFEDLVNVSLGYCRAPRPLSVPMEPACQCYPTSVRRCLPNRFPHQSLGNQEDGL